MGRRKKRIVVPPRPAQRHHLRVNHGLQVKSGQAVAPPFTKLSNGDETYLLDYAVYALPDGSWLVHVQRDDGNPVTCASPAGTARVECLYRESTVVGEGGGVIRSSTLLLDLSGQGGGGGGSAVVPGSSAPGAPASSPGAASPGGGSPSAAPSAGSGSGGGGSGGGGASPGSTVSVALVWAVALLAACLAMQPW